MRMFARSLLFNSALYTPVFIASTNGDVSAVTASITVTHPAGIAEGDLVVTLFQGNAISASPAGWTTDAKAWTDPASYRSALSYRTVNTADLSATWTYNIDVAAGFETEYLCAAYRNCAVRSVTWDEEVTPAPTTLTFPAIPRTRGGLISAVSTRDSNETMTPPTGLVTDATASPFAASWKGKIASGNYKAGSIVWTDMSNDTAFPAAGWVIEVG